MSPNVKAMANKFCIAASALLRLNYTVFPADKDVLRYVCVFCLMTFYNNSPIDRRVASSRQPSAGKLYHISRSPIIPSTHSTAEGPLTIGVALRCQRPMSIWSRGPEHCVRSGQLISTVTRPCTHGG